MTALDEPVREAEVDRLYQLPLDQFVTARAELAKRLGGPSARVVRSLPKPNLLAWALNRLYWSSRKTFDRLVAAAAQLRRAQAEALLGRRADLRDAGEAHREAIREALREATAILEASGHPATPDAIRELTGALEALPWKDRAGRLVRPPAASGFDALAGMPMAVEPARKEGRRTGKARRGDGDTRKVATSGAARGSGPAQRAHQAALKAARAAAAAARRNQSQAASRVARADKRVGAAAKREEEARQALADAERDRARAEEERRGANAALEEARRTVVEAARRLAEADETA